MQDPRTAQDPPPQQHPMGIGTSNAGLFIQTATCESSDIMDIDADMASLANQSFSPVG